MASSSSPHLLCFLLLIVSFSSSVSAAHRHHYHRRAAAGAAVSDQIQKACKATRYTSVCESTLSQAPGLPENPTANDFISASISTSSTDLKTAQSKAQAILDASASDLNRTNAAKNCLQFLTYSDRRLSATSRAVGGAALADARAWGSAALLYQYDCWSALKYVNGTNQVADAMTFILHLTNLTSNALSMVTALQRYGGDTSTWGPPQTERDGYWGDNGASGGQAGLGSQNGVPRGLKPTVTVCGDGCKYPTVQSAVDAAPAYGSDQFVVYIKEGVYKETVRVPFEKTNVVFLGDGMGKTVITGNLNADTVGLSTYNTATVGVAGDGFMASNITFSNTAGPDSHQAVAFVSDSDRSILESVEFLGHQDTLYAHSLRQLYKSCRISGTVDFIFGNSATVFQDSLILVVPRQLNPGKGESNTVTAHGRTDPGQSTGFVFYNCIVNGSEEYWGYYQQKPAVHRSYLGRPWKEYSRTVFINCYLEEIVRPEGWLPWSGDFALSTLFYGEFKNQGPAGNVTGRVPWSSQIPAEHVDVYSEFQRTSPSQVSSPLWQTSGGCRSHRPWSGEDQVYEFVSDDTADPAVDTVLEESVPEDDDQT